MCKYDTHIKAPTFSQAFRWFRENYNKLVAIEHCNRNGWYFIIRDITGIDDSMVKAISENCFSDYEEAELACLEKLIEIVESKNRWEELRGKGLDEPFKGCE